MSLSQHARLARALALAVPALLLGGAYVSQYGFGLYPCEMCWWQRWPHFAAVGLALLAYVIPPQRLWTGAAALAILVSGAIGLFHAGVEYGWFAVPTACSGTISGNTVEELKRQLMAQPVVRCDEVAWSLFGVSLAGYNFLASSALALFCATAAFRSAEKFRR